jgi:hypothetical protein
MTALPLPEGAAVGGTAVGWGAWVLLGAVVGGGALVAVAPGLHAPTNRAITARALHAIQSVLRDCIVSLLLR